MNLLAVGYRFILANILSLIVGVGACLGIIINILINPFKNPWATKRKLEPPAALSDSKYGVHKYIKANVPSAYPAVCGIKREAHSFFKIHNKLLNQATRQLTGTVGTPESGTSDVFIPSVKLHYVESGDPSKPLMLFIHGFPEFWYSWRHQIVYFNKDYRCVAVDMRGYGDSERPEGVQHYKIELLAADIKDLIHELGYNKCILVAHDWGGVVACKLRDTYPEVLDALILLGSTSLSAWLRQVCTTFEQCIKSFYVFLFRIPNLPEIFMQMNNLVVFDRTFKKKAEYVTHEDIECYKYWFGKQAGLTPPVNYYRANVNYTWSESIHEEKIPFLFAHGENEKYLSRTLLEIMRREYMYIETVIIDGCGHFMQQEDPGKVNKVVKEFLTKHHL